MKKVIPVFCMLISLIGCDSKKSKDYSITPKNVVVEKVHYRKLPVLEEVVGFIEAKNRAILSSKISGTIDRIYSPIGERVKKGSLLISFNAKEIESRLGQVVALLDQSQKDWSRIELLYKQGAVTKSEYDRALLQLKSAESSVSEAKAIESYTKILAPFDGIITRKFLNEGDLSTPGAKILEIENTEYLQVEAKIPQSLANNISFKQKLELDVEDNSYEAVVSEISTSADKETRTFLIKADILNSKNLKTGLFAKLLLPTIKEDCLMIPASFIEHKGSLDFVFVPNQNIANMRLVRTGRLFKNFIEILSGLDDGESIIENPKFLKDGERVEAKINGQ